MFNLQEQIDNFIQDTVSHISKARDKKEAVEILQAVIEDANKLIERIQNEIY
jgi:uncharacterized protein (DUF2267 family)